MGISSCFFKVDPGFTYVIVYCMYADHGKCLLLFTESVPRPLSPRIPGKGHDETLMCHSELKTARWEEHQGQAMRQRETFLQPARRKRSAINERLVSSSSSLWEQTEQNKKLKHVLSMLGNIRTTMKYFGLLSMITWLSLRSFVVPLTVKVIGIIKSLAFIGLSWLFIDGCLFHASLIICAFGKLSPESRK